MEEKTKTIVVKSWTDPITGKFKEGNPGGGRPLGTKNFSTDFDEVIEEVAKLNKITISEARKILLRKAFSEAKGGNFPFYKDICDRYYGKPAETIQGDFTQFNCLINLLKINKDGNTTDTTRDLQLPAESEEQS